MTVKGNLLRISVSFVLIIALSSCGSQAEVASSTAEPQPSASPSMYLLTDQEDFTRAVSVFKENGCKPEITRPKGMFSDTMASMDLYLGANIIKFPVDMINHSDELEWGTLSDKTLVVSAAYMSLLGDLYFYVFDLYRSEMRAYQSTFNSYFSKASKAASQLCNLKPANIEIVAFEDDGVSKTRKPELDAECKVFKPQAKDQLLKISGDSSILCSSTFTLSEAQIAKATPILKNLLDNWFQFERWHENATAAEEAISAGISADVESLKPHCAEYPTDNPNYNIVKCTGI